MRLFWLSRQRNAAHSGLPVEIGGCYLWLRTPPGPSPRNHSRPEHAHEPQTFVSVEPFPVLAADVMRGLQCHFLGAANTSDTPLFRCAGRSQDATAGHIDGH